MLLTDDELFAMYKAFAELFEDLPDKEYQLRHSKTHATNRRGRIIIDAVHTRPPSTLFAVVTLALAGCGGIDIKRIVPENTNPAGHRFEQSLKIVEPIGGQKSKFGVQDYVENPEMHAALMGAFQHANLFSRVTDI